MTKESQRIAIAEACGFHQVKWQKMDCRNNDGWFGLPKTHKGNDGGFYDWERLPDYLNDLNAMHEAEKVADIWTNSDKTVRYIMILRDVVSGKDINGCFSLSEAADCTAATAAQRAEAFLRTLGVWKDDASHLSMVASITASIKPRD